MKEEFLHFLWKHRLYDQEQLLTESGKKLRVISPGFQNNDAGPDFSDARLMIDHTVWVGNVEIHTLASDWKRHNHHEDKAYDTVILHVVEKPDQQVCTTQGEPIETFKMVYSPILSRNYAQLLLADQPIRCASKLKDFPDLHLQFWLNSLLAERLEQKTALIRQELDLSTNNWNETFYRFLAKSFGFKINDVPFELLAKALPLKILAKHREHLLQLEALLFGTSGLLNDSRFEPDDYMLKLRKEYDFLRQKYQLKPLQPSIWKFARMRPLSFPSVRIAQFAMLIHRSYALFSKVIELDDLVELRRLLQVNTSVYWEKHYVLGKTSELKIKPLGRSSIHGLLINVLIPFLFIYASAHGDEQRKERALRFLEELPAEQNSIISTWTDLGVKLSSASHSQALLQLYKAYCLQKRCLRCAIGLGAVSKTTEN